MFYAELDAQVRHGHLVGQDECSTSSKNLRARSRLPNASALALFAGALNDPIIALALIQPAALEDRIAFTCRPSSSSARSFRLGQPVRQDTVI